LIGEVLAHEIYIFGKRGSNVTCRKKPHQNWPNGLGDMALWSSRFSEIDSIITCQPHMGIESSRTFWKWENKIFNFHVGQKFIWGLYHNVSLRIKTFHLWQVSVTGPVSILGNSWSGFKFFHDGVWHDVWWLFGHEWTLTNQFQSSNHWLNGQLTNSWLFRVSDWLCIDWWLPNPNSLRTWLQMMSQVVWTLDYWPWWPNSTRMTTIHCFDWQLTFLGFLTVWAWTADLWALNPWPKYFK